MDNKILASTLMELIETSETTFNGKEDKELISQAAKLGIIVPNPDLAVFKTVYAEINKVNRNGVILPKKAVEAGLQTLIGKQINWEHDGSGRICGYMVDAKISGEQIVVYGVLFKSLFKDEFEKVEKLFADKKLFVSFEIWNRDEKGNSVLHDAPNGHKSIDPIIFHGCGLLLKNPPACPNARVLKLLATEKVIEEAEQIVKKIFEKDERLVYAEMANEEPKCKGCNPCKCKKGGEKTIMADEIKVEKTEETVVKVEETIVASEVKTEETVIKAEEVATTTEVKPEETVKAEEAAPAVKPEETAAKVETTPEEHKEEAATTITEKVERTTTDVIDENKETIKTEVKVETKREDDNGNVSTQTREVTEVVTYTYEQVQAKVEEAKVEAQKLIEAKDKEIAEMKLELGKKDQEIAELKVVHAELDKSKATDMTVGEVTEKGTDKYRTIRENVDNHAFPKRK